MVLKYFVVIIVFLLSTCVDVQNTLPLPPSNDESFLVENNYDYPVSFNGKMRFKISLPLSLTKDQIEEKVLSSDKTKQQIANKEVKRVIIVPGKIVNIVV